MKKYFLIISTLFFLFSTNSCDDKELELFPPSLDEIGSIDSESKLQQLLNGAYISIASTNVFGTQAMVYGDIMGDKMFVNSNPSFYNTYTFNYNSTQQGEISGFYEGLYSVISKCNIIVNNNVVPDSDNFRRLKGEAKILRALAYFTLVNYYSASPTSGANQEYGVPLVLGNYDVNIKPARASVNEVYNQIIADLKDGIIHADISPSKKTNLGQTAAKLILSKVYLTRRAAGDANLALQMADDVISVAVSNYISGQSLNPFIADSNIVVADYYNYFAALNDDDSEDHPETVWELDLNANTNRATGIGANIALPAYYYRLDPKRCFLFNQTFYNSFSTTDVRRGTATATSLLTQTGAPAISIDNPRGYWTNKYPQISSSGRYYRNIKIFRFSEAYLNRIEALHLMGQDVQALTELNRFATSRKGNTYTAGTDMLNNILTERSKEFYGEGQRFLDLKRHNISLTRPSNCTVCNLSASDKLYVFPVSQGSMNSNENLKQYPGYN